MSREPGDARRSGSRPDPSGGAAPAGPEVPDPEDWVDPAERMSERLIREAIERGEFDDLPGAGKPLDLRGADDPDWWVKGLMEREGLDTAALGPTVFVLRREAQSFPDSLFDLPSEDAVRERIADYNRRVRLDRLQPSISTPLPVIAPIVDADEMVARWHEARAERAARAAQTADGPKQPTDAAASDRRTRVPQPSRGRMRASLAQRPELGDTAPDAPESTDNRPPADRRTGLRSWWRRLFARPR